VRRASNVVSCPSVVVVVDVVVVVVGSLQHLCTGFLLQLMILQTGDFPLPNLGRCLVGRGLGRGRVVVFHVGRGGRGRRRADRLGVPEFLGVAGEVGGVRREGRGRRVLWVVTSPSSPAADPPLRSGGRCGMDFLVGRTLFGLRTGTEPGSGFRGGRGCRQHGWEERLLQLYLRTRQKRGAYLSGRSEEVGIWLISGGSTITSLICEGSACKSSSFLGAFSTSSTFSSVGSSGRSCCLLTTNTVAAAAAAEGSGKIVVVGANVSTVVSSTTGGQHLVLGRRAQFGFLNLQ